MLKLGTFQVGHLQIAPHPNHGYIVMRWTSRLLQVWDFKFQRNLSHNNIDYHDTENVCHFHDCQRYYNYFHLNIRN